MSDEQWIFPVTNLELQVVTRQLRIPKLWEGTGLCHERFMAEVLWSSWKCKLRNTVKGTGPYHT
ncbi:predicted protein [Botrytis cinerea T4]|uniref:Uncharacterized protein n=1 Tax=Botryotinia fuckeliana (strain T4) TaxID=999810 RepID=G2XUA6_BOTF4|nr:predicted protein [Botrytis cinerea T4]